MDNQPTPQPSPVVKPKPSRGLFYYLQIVIFVAFVLATLFTAWTPSDLLPQSLAEKLTNVLAAPDQTESAQQIPPTSTPRPQPKIGIVSGHWGNDPGAVCPDGTKEADVNLDVATRVKESLVGEGYQVDLLKEFDPRLIDYRASLLVSIHSDSCEYINDQATGFKVSAAQSTQYPEKAARLTACLRTRYGETTGLPFHPGSVTADMTSYHAFEEINANTTAAIIEIGFLNLDHEILTKQPDLIAHAVTQGILCYVRNEDVTSQPTTTPTTAP